MLVTQPAYCQDDRVRSVQRRFRGVALAMFGLVGAAFATGVLLG